MIYDDLSERSKRLIKDAAREKKDVLFATLCNENGIQDAVQMSELWIRLQTDIHRETEA